VGRYRACAPQPNRYVAEIDMLKIIKAPIIIALILVSASASAEVMDKEPALIENLSWGFIGGVLWYLAARYKPWLLVALIPMPTLHYISLISEIRSSDVGPHILIEAGPVYIYTAYGLAVFMVICIFLGLFLRRKTLQHNNSLNPDAPNRRAD